MPELKHGEAVAIASGVRRITAPNPGIMTGAGTNTYLLGAREVAVVDPGPDIPAHVDAILQAIADGGGRLARIFATHTHTDHSPATASLLRAAPVEVVGAMAPDRMFQDERFAPDIQCVNDQVFETGEYRLRAIHTPGHVANHFCFLDERSGLLITGDHIMNGSTVVIVPPSGDMAAYIDSLQRLLAYPMEALAPGHGDVMGDPRGVIEGLVRHRLGREAKVLRVLGALGSGDLDTLVAGVYDDVAPQLHPMAKLSLLAHLIKLEGEARAARDGELWRPKASR